MTMHRFLWRAARRSFNPFSDASKLPHRAQANASNRVHSTDASTQSHDYDHFGWRGKLVGRFAQLEIVNALRRGDRQRASMMLLKLGDANGPLSAEDFSDILDYCAETPDPLFVMETWKFMKEKTIDLNKRSYRSIIRALSKGGYSKEALDWLTFLGENESVHSALPMFNIFLSACGNTINLNNAESCLEIMETQLLGKSEITYWELLKLAVLQRNLSAVCDIWKDCTRYYSPSIITLRKFIWSFARLGDLQSAYNILQHMMTLAGQSSVAVRVSAKQRYQSSRLDIPVPAIRELPDLKVFLDHDSSPSSCEGKLGTKEYSRNVHYELSHGEEQSIQNMPLKDDGKFISACLSHHANAQGDIFTFEKPELVSARTTNTFEGAPVAVRNFVRWSFNDVIHACLRSNNYQLAEQLFLEMQNIGLRPSRHTYDGFVKAVLAGKGVMHAIKVIEAMEKRNIKPYNDTFAALSIGHSKHLQLDLAEDFLERISDKQQKYIHAFNALLAGCDIMNEPERAVRILAKIKHMNIKLNIRTYELLFSLLGNVNVPYEEGNMLSHVDVSKRISIIEMDMLNNNIQHNFASMKNVIRALGAEGMIEEMLRYLNVAENILWCMDPYQKHDIYNIVLRALVDAKDTHKAIRIFKNMRSSGLPANVAIYNIMIECCKVLACSKSACALLSLMIRDGFCPQTLTYTSLFKVVLANEDFESALDLLDLSRAEGIQPDIQLFNTILGEAYIKGRIHVIEHIIERIHREKIQPDPSTLWYTFSAYVECELYNTAIEALQVLSMRMISEEASILEEKRAVLEDLVFSEEPDAEFRIMKVFEAFEEFLATALLNLRWCAIIGSPISWSPEESFWARRLASSYDANRRPNRSKIS